MKRIILSLPFVFVIVLYVGFYMDCLPVFTKPPNYADRGTFGDSFGVLNTLFSGLAFAAVFVTIWVQQGQIKGQAKEHADEVAERRSLFNLESSLEAYLQARSLLQDGHNDRGIWIRAGRLLGHAKVLGAGVTKEEHQRVLEFKRLEYRTFFNNFLESRSDTYFYGVPFDGADINEVARRSTASEECNGRRVTSTVHELSEESIRSVWEAAQWPDDFIDPLGGGFSVEERAKMILKFRALKSFLDHKDQWHSASGQLYPRAPRPPEQS